MLNMLKELGLIVLEKEPEQLSDKVTIVVEGDFCDADYITSSTEYYLDDKNSLNMLKEALNLLREHGDIITTPHFLRGGYEDLDLDEDEEGNVELTEEAYSELLDKLMYVVNLPHGVDDICHTITSINIYYTDKTGNTVEMQLVDEVA